MDIYFTPLMVSDDNKTRLPAPPGRKIDPNLIPLTPGAFNKLERREDGLCVPVSELLSSVAPNALEIAPDSGLRVALGLKFEPMSSELSLVNSSGEKVATAQLPAQAGLPVTAEILSNFTPPAQDMNGVLTPLPTGTYLHLQFKMSDGSRKDLYLNVEDLVDVYQAGVGIDVQNNVISVQPDELLNPHEKMLFVQSGKFRTQVTLKFDAVNESLQLLGVGNDILTETSLPLALGRPTDIEYVRDLERPGYPVADYLKFTYASTTEDGEPHVEYVAMGKLAQAPEAGDGIRLDDGRIINVVIDTGHGLGFNKAKELTIKPSELLREGEQVLSAADGELFTTLGLKIQGTKLVLTGIGGKGISTATIPVGGNPAFSEVLYGFTPPPQHGQEGEPKTGTYLHFHYDTPEEYDIYIDITDAVGYPGPGISIKKGVISLNIAEAKGLLVDPDTGAVGVDTTNIISVDPQNVLGRDENGKLLLKLSDIIEPNGALHVNSNGKLDIDMDKINAPVSADSDNALKLGSDKRPYLPGDPGTL